MIDFGKKGLIVTIALFIDIIATGCVQYQIVPWDRPAEIGKSFQVKPTVNWNKSTGGGVETWTIDGPQLERLIFFAGVEDGKPLWVVLGEKAKEMPLYRSSMNALEIRELFEATFARSGMNDAAIIEMNPATFGNLTGFKIQFNYVSPEGLKYSGMFIGGQKDGKLLGIMYMGASQYYYRKHLSEVDNILASVLIL